MKIEKKEAKGSDYLSLALYAFGGLGMELIYVFFVGPLLYGGPMNQWSSVQMIIHWVITCITWILFGYVILQYANKKYGFQFPQTTEPVKPWQLVLTVVFIVLSLTSTYIDWNGIKVLKEFQGKGPLLFSFQYVYYFVETFLFMLIIVFGQLAFEVWFQKPNLPYGGIVVALTWGLGHWLSKGSLAAGIYTAIGGFGFGVVYLLLNRNIKWTYAALCIMFLF